MKTQTHKQEDRFRHQRGGWQAVMNQTDESVPSPGDETGNRIASFGTGVLITSVTTLAISATAISVGAPSPVTDVTVIASGAFSLGGAAAVMGPVSTDSFVKIKPKAVIAGALTALAALAFVVSDYSETVSAEKRPAAAQQDRGPALLNIPRP